MYKRVFCYLNSGRHTKFARARMVTASHVLDRSKAAKGVGEKRQVSYWVCDKVYVRVY